MLASEQSNGLPDHAYYHAYLLQKESRSDGPAGAELDRILMDSKMACSRRP